jgi:type IV secretory pathway VirB10-like protein
LGGSLVSPPVRRAGLVGAGAGLAIVAMIVIGARLAYHSAPATLPAPPAATTNAAEEAPSLPTEMTAPPAPVSLPPPTVAPTPIATRTPPRRKPRPAPTAEAKATPGSAESQANAATKEIKEPKDTAKPASTASADEAETASTSLVPVIPSSPPPEVDPLVKAVLDDDRK